MMHALPATRSLRRLTAAGALALTILAAPTQLAEAQARHPLDPLSAAEIRSAATLLSASPQWVPGALYSMIVLKEPAKSVVVGYADGAQITREAFAVILDRRGNRTFEAAVDLGAQRVTSWTEMKGVQPLVLAGEYEAISEIVKSDERWQAAMKKRGIDQFDKLLIDAWAVGQVPTMYAGVRLLRALTYYKDGAINFYGRPVEGVVALINMNSGKVVEVVDTGVLPLPPPSQQLDTASTGRREAPKPLVITQPEGASFTITGNEIRWQKWRFRYAMHPREGVVLQTVGYEDDRRVRPILYRASLSEMVVPYGDADRNWRWRSAFDVGEYSVGRLASSIERGTDAPEHATLIDVTFANDNGEPEVLPRGVAIYERDGGMLWKHYDGYSRRNESRRGRQLVVSFIATIGNYDYAVNWIFHQDGVLEVDAALSGIMLPKGVRETKAPAHATASSGHLVSANVVAPHHQHFFSFRLDLDVDGQKNSVHEMNTRAMPAGAANPSLNGILMEETRLATERAAQRTMSMESARTWAVVNPDSQNTLGQHTSYIIVPGSNSVPYVGQSAPVRKRAGFINSHFWATRFDASEMNAAGVYPNQSTGGDGLPRFVANNQSLVGQDVVVWYTLGVTHIPRPEEWPIMPVTHVGFKLVPGSFFVRNPALDVPRE